jgi:hypothetical protein
MSNCLTSTVAKTLNPNLGDSSIFAAVEACISNEQFTAILYHPKDMELERVYSNSPQSYPVGGPKSKSGMPWAELVLVNGRV